MDRSFRRNSPTAFGLSASALLCSIALASTAADAAEQAVQAKDFAVSLYAGRLTNSDWRDSISGQADYVDSRLVVGALGWTFKRAEDRSWSLELEGNVAKHFGDQDHWEFNALVSGRWHRFPWSDTVATSVAFGFGPSYATEVPKVEVANDGDSARLLLFWHLELTLGPPKGDWEAMLRLHHRSTGYGVFGDDGGGNAVTAGVRYHF